MTVTMVKLRKETVARLVRLKDYERQTYDEIVGKLISIREEELSKDDIRNIEEGLRDLKAGRVYSSAEVAKRLGINW